MRYPSSVSAAPFLPLTTADELEAAIAESFQRPVILFKHSFTCGTSAEAHEELADVIGTLPVARWYLVDVRSSRPLSMLIAERFGIRHESPQLLVLAAGQVRWSGSHYRVTGAAVQAALAELTAA